MEHRLKEYSVPRPTRNYHRQLETGRDVPFAAQPVGQTAQPVVLSVVVPCYDEAANLAVLYDRTVAACREAVGERFEIVLVNDGSHDATWEHIMALAERDHCVLGVDLSRNHGHQLAVSAGLSVCRGELILILDADLQDPPEALGPMLELMSSERADVVYGQRSQRDGETRFKKATAAAFYRLLGRMVDIRIPRDTGDFRLMNRRVLEVLLAMPERQRFIRGMVSWAGFKQVPYHYQRAGRLHGTTHYPFSKMLNLAIDAIASFSITPLKVASYCGLIFGAIAMLIGGYALISFMGGYAIKGWTSIMAVVTLMGSITLLVLGIMGEYLGRLYMEAKARPLFIIREVVGGPNETEPPTTAVPVATCPLCKMPIDG